MTRFVGSDVLCSTRRPAFLLSVLILAIAAFGASASPTNAQSGGATAEAKQHYQNAVAAIAKSDWPTAVPELEQAERLAPDKALIHYDLALAYSHIGQIKSAQNELNTAIRLGLPLEQAKNADELKKELAQKRNDVGTTNASIRQNQQGQTQSLSIEDTVKYIETILKQNPSRDFLRSTCLPEYQPYGLPLKNENSEIYIGTAEFFNRNGYHCVYTFDVAPAYKLGPGKPPEGCTQRGQVTAVCGDESVVEIACLGDEDCIFSDSLTPDKAKTFRIKYLYCTASEEILARLDKAVVHLEKLLRDLHEGKNNSDDPFAH